MQEIDHHLETFIGVVDDHVLLANGGEHIAIMRQHPFGIAWGEGSELEVGAWFGADRIEIAQAQHSASLHDHSGIDIELIAQQCFCRRIAFVIELQKDRAATTAPLDGRPEETNQVFRFVFDLNVAVAQNAEYAVAEDLEAGEHAVGKSRDQLFDRDIDCLSAGHTHEAWNSAWDEDHLDKFAFALAALQPEQDTHPPARNKGEGVGRVDRLRCDQRQNVGFEILFEPFLLRLGKLFNQGHDDTRLGQ